MGVTIDIVLVHVTYSTYQVKIWDTSGDLNSTKLLQRIPTEHRGNIFCVDFDKIHDRYVYSCAADGTLRSTDIYSRVGGSILVDSDQLMYKFI